MASMLSMLMTLWYAMPRHRRNYDTERKTITYLLLSDFRVRYFSHTSLIIMQYYYRHNLGAFFRLSDRPPHSSRIWQLTRRITTAHGTVIFPHSLAYVIVSLSISMLGWPLYQLAHFSRRHIIVTKCAFIRCYYFDMPQLLLLLPLPILRFRYGYFSFLIYYFVDDIEYIIIWAL